MDAGGRSLPSTFHLLPTTFYLLPSTFYLLPSTYYLLPSTFHLLPTTFYLPPSTFYRPPSTFYLLPSTFYLLPSTFNPAAASNALVPPRMSWLQRSAGELVSRSPGWDWHVIMPSFFTAATSPLSVSE